VSNTEHNGERLSKGFPKVTMGKITGASVASLRLWRRTLRSACGMAV